MDFLLYSLSHGLFLVWRGPLRKGIFVVGQRGGSFQFLGLFSLRFISEQCFVVVMSLAGP